MGEHHGAQHYFTRLRPRRGLPKGRAVPKVAIQPGGDPIHNVQTPKPGQIVKLRRPSVPRATHAILVTGENTIGGRFAALNVDREVSAHYALVRMPTVK